MQYLYIPEAKLKKWAERRERQYEKPTVWSRKRIYQRDNWQCVYCGRKLVKPTAQRCLDSPSTIATLDHLIPQIMGGPTTPDNLVTACSECNGKKGCLLPLNFFMTAY